MIHLDTHVVVWLYLRLNTKLSAAARREIRQADDIRISPMVMIELEDLISIGRIRVPSPEAVLGYLDEALNGVTLSRTSFADVAHHARTIGWTRDPFDRLIVANAVVDQARLVTADARINEHFRKAVW
ncbi:type II toxin-antitoxin system VapC family toxin [Brevundimonas sp. VNH65]|uniref:type II toxin-antitoxin system VapC family toxin n=1 Tax=Brevundimonas sp. VNH65 TaxID=3400917 RepID=UPI003C0F71ED